jgi:hypothetical protein
MKSKIEKPSAMETGNDGPRNGVSGVIGKSDNVGSLEKSQQSRNHTW